MIKIVLTFHVRQRMEKRGISRADLESAIRNATMTGPCDNGGTRYLGPGVDGRLLKVWTVLDDGPVMVIKSAAWKGE